MDYNQNNYSLSTNSSVVKNTSGNNGGSLNQEIEDPEKILSQFKDRLMEDLNLDNPSPEQKKQIEDKISQLVNDRILNLIMMYLPEDKVAELDKMIGQKSQDEVMQFIMASVPGIQDKIAEELFEIRNDLLNSLRQNNAIGE